MADRPDLEIEPIPPGRPGELQVCYATDAGYVGQVELSAFSLIRRCTVPVRLVILCSDDALGRFRRLDAIVSRFPKVRVVYRRLDFFRTAMAGPSHEYLPVTSFGRLTLPFVLQGRVLYLDGDTLVLRDVAPALSMDLGDALVGCVDDTLTLHEVRLVEARHKIRGGRMARMLPEAIERLGVFRGIGLTPERYFNTGVMLMDLDRIRAVPEITDHLLDHERASGFPTYDQDHINMLFAGRILSLPPEWNAWTKVSRTRAFPFTAADRARYRVARRTPIVAHFYFRPKPWDAFSFKRMLRGLPMFRAYWREERRLARAVAEIDLKAQARDSG